MLAEFHRNFSMRLTQRWMRTRINKGPPKYITYFKKHPNMTLGLLKDNEIFLGLPCKGFCGNEYSLSPTVLTVIRIFRVHLETEGFSLLS